MKLQAQLQALRAERDEAADNLRNLVEARQGKTWTQEDTAKYDKGLREIDRIDAELDRVEKSLGIDNASQAALNPRGAKANSAGAPGAKFVDAETGRPLMTLNKDTMHPQSSAMRSIGASLPGVEGDGTLADMLRGVAGLKHGSEGVRNALSVGTDAAGGFTVPASVLRTVLAALSPASSLLQAGAQVLMLEEDARQYRVARVGTLPTAAWRAESGLIADSDPAFNAIDLTPRSLAVMFRISRELLADAPNIETILTDILARSLARELDRVGLRGTGTAPQPRGILNTAGIQAITNGASLATVRWQNLLSAYQAIATADAPLPTAVIAAPRTVVGFGALADTTNQPLLLPPLLQNMQMVTSSQIPVNLTVGTSTDCSEAYVADFSQFAFAMRESLSIQLLRERYADTGEIGFVAHVRVDTLPMYPQAFALITGIRP